MLQQNIINSNPYNFKNADKVCILTNGCDENRIDSARIQDFFVRNGLASVKEFSEADFILFNACALTKYNEERSLSFINYLKKNKKSQAKLIVFGCLSKINEKRLREVYRGPTFGSDEINQLEVLCNYKLKANDIHANHLLPLTTLKKPLWFLLSCRENGIAVTLAKIIVSPYWQKKRRTIHSYNPQTYSIKVSTGCTSACTYCGVRLSRGTVKSKSVEQVCYEFDEGLKKGFKEFALIGTDLGSYGRDLGINLIFLIKKILQNKGDYKIKLSTCIRKYDDV